MPRNNPAAAGLSRVSWSIPGEHSLEVWKGAQLHHILTTNRENDTERFHIL